MAVNVAHPGGPFSTRYFNCKDFLHVAAHDTTADVYPAYEWDAVASLALMEYALFPLIGFSATKASTLFRF